MFHSRITDEENFAELPPIEIMNNVKKESPKMALKELEEQERITPKSALKNYED